MTMNTKSNRKAWVCIVIGIVVIIITCFLIAYIKVPTMNPPGLITGQITLELYQRNDTGNIIVWKVKSIEWKKDIVWTDIHCLLLYNNSSIIYKDGVDGHLVGKYHVTGEAINNTSVDLPTGKVKVGDLIVVNAPWDGDAKFILEYTPYGGTTAETSIEHY